MNRGSQCDPLLFTVAVLRALFFVFFSQSSTQLSWIAGFALLHSVPENFVNVLSQYGIQKDVLPMEMGRLVEQTGEPPVDMEES